MKRLKGRMPWYAWFSIFGLGFLILEVRAAEERIRQERRRDKRPAADRELNRYLGFAGRFLGFMLGLVFLPWWLLDWRLDSMWELHPVIANCFFLLYIYPIGIFITNHLYHYYFSRRKW